MNYYISVIKNYATFTGRARRSEYWMFTLFNIIFFLIASILDNAIGDTFTNPMTGMNMYYGYIYVVYALFVLIPSFAVLVRRLHDIGKSGWLLVITIIVMVAGLGILIAGFHNTAALLLIVLIQLIGSIWTLVLLCIDSNVGPNKYGPNPKGIGNDDEFDFMKMPDALS